MEKGYLSKTAMEGAIAVDRAFHELWGMYKDLGAERDRLRTALEGLVEMIPHLQQRIRDMECCIRHAGDHLDSGRMTLEDAEAHILNMRMFAQYPMRVDEQALRASREVLGKEEAKGE